MQWNGLVCKIINICFDFFSGSKDMKLNKFIKNKIKWKWKNILFENSKALKYIITSVDIYEPHCLQK